MNIKNRIKKIEMQRKQNFSEWIKTLTDEELEGLINRYPKNERSEAHKKWLETLTDNEVETLRYGKPGARALRGKFNEYQKQNQKN